MRTVKEVVAEDAKVFSTLDETSGFWTLKLDEESSNLTTFQTPQGRYRCLCAPFGIKSIPEIYQRVMTEIFQNIGDDNVIVDDIIVSGEDMQQHDNRLRKVFQKVKEYNVNLNSAKCQLRKEEVNYVGHIISKDDLKSDPEK